MKKFLSISIIMILIIGMLGGVVNAASASISSSSKSVYKGDTVTVTVSFGDKVGAAQFNLNVDTSKLKLESISPESAEYNINTKKCSYASATKEISSISFKFKTLATGKANFSISGVQTAKEGQNKTSISIGNSSTTVTINEKPATKPTTTTTKPTTTTTKPKEEAKEPVKLDPTPNELIKLDNENAKTLKHDETNVIVKYMSNAFENGVILEAKKIDTENEKYQSINEMLKGITGNKIYFDINLLKDNVKIQPNGYVTVYLPIPEEYNKEKLELYYIDEENSSYKLIEGEVQGNYYTFTANHFSTYALIERVEQIEPIQEVSVVETVRDVFTNVILLYVIIAILVIIVIVQRVKISKLQD